MNEEEFAEEARRHRWFNPTINVTHLITTAAAIVACFWYIAELDKQITRLETDLKHERIIRQTVMDHLEEELTEHEQAAVKEHDNIKELLKELYLLMRPGR